MSSSSRSRSSSPLEIPALLLSPSSTLSPLTSDSESTDNDTIIINKINNINKNNINKNNNTGDNDDNNNDKDKDNDDNNNLKVPESKLKSIIESQFNLEILLKHRELSLIEDEMAKIRVMMVKLRNAIPSLNTHLLQNDHPHKEVDGFTSVYMAHLLAASSEFLKKSSDSNQTDDKTTNTHKHPYNSRSQTHPSIRRDYRRLSNGLPSIPKPLLNTTKSNENISNCSSKSKSHVQKTIPNKNPKKNTSPRCITRRSDGSLVQLNCPACQRSDFNNSLEFINHCRLSHNIEFNSHDAAAKSCGVLLPVQEQDEIGKSAINYFNQVSSALNSILPSTVISPSPTPSPVLQTKKSVSQSVMPSVNTTCNNNNNDNTHPTCKKSSPTIKLSLKENKQDKQPPNTLYLEQHLNRQTDKCKPDGLLSPISVKDFANESMQPVSFSHLFPGESDTDFISPPISPQLTYSDSLNSVSLNNNIETSKSPTETIHMNNARNISTILPISTENLLTDSKLESSYDYDLTRENSKKKRLQILAATEAAVLAQAQKRKRLLESNMDNDINDINDIDDNQEYDNTNLKINSTPSRICINFSPKHSERKPSNKKRKRPMLDATPNSNNTSSATTAVI